MKHSGLKGRGEVEEHLRFLICPSLLFPTPLLTTTHKQKSLFGLCPEISPDQTRLNSSDSDQSYTGNTFPKVIFCSYSKNQCWTSTQFGKYLLRIYICWSQILIQRRFKSEYGTTYTFKTCTLIKQWAIIVELFHRLSAFQIARVSF